MPDTTRYRQRPNEVDAIQWTGHNADALRAFAGIDFATIDPEDRVEDLDCDAQLLIEASHWVGIKPTDWVLKFEGYFIAKDDAPFRAVWEPASTAPLAVGLPARLEAALTERFTELGNPFSAMHRQEKGPDGWPASHPVGPHHVAEVLRELLTAAPAVVPSAPADRAALVKRVAAALSEHGIVHLNDPDLSDEYDCCAEAALYAVDEARCPTPLTHNWGCGCPGDRLPLYSDRGVDTPGCDCGHNGMGMRWHDGSGCAWFKQLTEEGRRLLADDDGGEAQQPETHATPCSQPNPCEDGGDPCTTHEREQAHTEGDHALCGSDCTAGQPSLGGALRIVADWYASSEGRDVLVEDLTDAGYPLPTEEATS